MAADGNVVPLVVGPAVAAVTGWLAIEVLMRAIARGSLRGFSVYCWIVGALVLAWSVWSGVGSQVG